ncbi:MAG TPA: hypothetical protein VG759_02195 [Candidatus Angelobacter sp.]|jgi:hypothetical protein|nr:hypothetical protein [Candidatus Angelobacter sp.]
MKQSNLSIRVLRFLVVLMAATSLSGALNGHQSQPRQADDVPIMDGEAGPCSVEFTVTNAEGKPILNALISVHIAYGFGGVRKLDTGVYTNAEGKGKFIGLPAKVHKPPLEFRATKDDLVGVASYNPASECQAKHSIMMEKKGK